MSMGLNIVFIILAFCVGTGIGFFFAWKKSVSLLGEKESELVRATTKLESYQNLGEIFQKIMIQFVQRFFEFDAFIFLIGIEAKLLGHLFSGFQQVVDTTMQKGCAEWFCQIGISSRFVAFFFILK